MKQIYTLLFTFLLLAGSYASWAFHHNVPAPEATLAVYATDTVIGNNVQPLVTDAEDVFAAPAVYVFPNPTFGSLYLEINDDRWQGSTATLHNIIGETLDERVVGTGSHPYDLARFPRGFYFINLRLGEQQQTLRFVKR